MEGNNEDEEPQICTVFSSTPSSQSKTIFDTIAFSNPKKESSLMSPSSPFPEDDKVASTSKDIALPASQLFGETSTLSTETPAAVASSISLASIDAGLQNSQAATFESLPMSYTSADPPASVFGGESILSKSQTPQKQDIIQGQMTPVSGDILSPLLNEGLSEDNIRLVSKEIDSLSLTPTPQPIAGESSIEIENEQDSPLPTANTLFSDAPEVPFPIGIGANPPPPATPLKNSDVEETLQRPIDSFSSSTYTVMDAAYDAWIPSEEARKVLMNIATAVNAGTYFPDKSHMTTPGIIYKEDLVDKVSVNMSRIFGEVEASKRQILTADSVTQDDNGIRELIKLGCYRSAINLTKRLLTLYGQGPGKIGQFSKHSPHSLQLWMTRIALLVRIREFKIAESELEAFANFDNPDMYYEYYQDSYGPGRKGSMIPFYFRLVAAEIPQYASKSHNDSIDKLSKMLQTVQQIIRNVSEGICEDGSSVTIDQERQNISLEIWRKRELRLYYSLTNAFLLAKDFANSLRYLTALRDKDTERKAQLTSAIGRLFLQYGDLSTSQKYFKEAAAIRNSESESEKVENLIDASLYFIAQGVYADAFGLLKEALVIQPDNFMITNNMAVCLLYMGKVKESLSLMETTVRNNTPQLLQENVILNLSTIYELENSDGFKKNALLKLISEYKGDGINLASLKMPNLI